MAFAIVCCSGGEEGEADWQTGREAENQPHVVANIVESNKRFNRTTTQKLSGKNKFKCKYNA